MHDGVWQSESRFSFHLSESPSCSRRALTFTFPGPALTFVPSGNLEVFHPGFYMENLRSSGGSASGSGSSNPTFTFYQFQRWIPGGCCGFFERGHFTGNQTFVFHFQWWYFSTFFIWNQVKDLQWFTKVGKRGGPLILTQLENEFGQNGFSDHPR